MRAQRGSRRRTRRRAPRRKFDRGHAAMTDRWGRAPPPRFLEPFGPSRVVSSVSGSPPRRAARPSSEMALSKSRGRAMAPLSHVPFWRQAKASFGPLSGDDDAAVLARALGPDARVVRSDGDGRPVLFSKFSRESQYTEALASRSRLLRSE